MNYQQLLDSQKFSPDLFVGSPINAQLALAHDREKQYDAVRGSYDLKYNANPLPEGHCCIKIPVMFDMIYNIRVNSYMEPIRLELRNEDGSIHRVFFPKGNLFTFDTPLYHLGDCTLHIFTGYATSLLEYVHIEGAYLRSQDTRDKITEAFRQTLA